MDSCYFSSSSSPPISTIIPSTSSSTAAYRRRSSSSSSSSCKRYHPYQKKHLATTTTSPTTTTLYPTSPDSSSLPLFTSLPVPSQTGSPLSSVSSTANNQLMSPSFLRNDSNVDSPMLSPFALFGSLPPSDRYTDNDNNNNNDTDLGDIMDDDQIFAAFAQLPSSTSSTNSTLLSIQSPPLSPSLVPPQDLIDLDDFSLF